jgi:hypothetical protein
MGASYLFRQDSAFNNKSNSRIITTLDNPELCAAISN